MARVGCLHYVGTFLLFAASMLLLVTTITSPVVSSLSILYVGGPTSSITYGTFGYCVQGVAAQGNGGNQYCSKAMVGYDAAGVLTSVVNTQIGSNQRDSINNLTSAMVLHPIAAVLAFIAFLISAGAGFFGSFLGSVLAFIAWLVTLVIMAIDLAMFGLLKNHVNSNGAGVHADYSIGMWTCVAAMASLFVGSVVVLCTCCSTRHGRYRDRDRRRWFY